MRLHPPHIRKMIADSRYVVDAADVSGAKGLGFENALSRGVTYGEGKTCVPDPQL